MRNYETDNVKCESDDSGMRSARTWRMALVVMGMGYVYFGGKSLYGRAIRAR